LDEAAAIRKDSDNDSASLEAGNVAGFAIPAEDMRKSLNSDFANIQEVVFVSLLPIPSISKFPDLVIDLKQSFFKSFNMIL